MEITVEENAMIAFVVKGRFTEHRFAGTHYHMYVLDLGRVGQLYVSVFAEDVEKIELNEPYNVKMKLYGKYRENKAGNTHLNNMLKVFDLKKITEDEAAINETELTQTK